MGSKQRLHGDHAIAKLMCFCSIPCQRTDNHMIFFTVLGWYGCCRAQTVTWFKQQTRRASATPTIIHNVVSWIPPENHVFLCFWCWEPCDLHIAQTNPKDPILLSICWSQFQEGWSCKEKGKKVMLCEEGFCILSHPAGDSQNWKGRNGRLGEDSEKIWPWELHGIEWNFMGVSWVLEPWAPNYFQLNAWVSLKSGSGLGGLILIISCLTPVLMILEEILRRWDKRTAPKQEWIS